MSLYGYGSGSPNSGVDSLGLTFQSPFDGHAAASGGSGTACPNSGGDSTSDPGPEPLQSPLYIPPAPSEANEPPGKRFKWDEWIITSLLEERVEKARAIGDGVEQLLEWEKKFLIEAAWWLLPGGTIIKVGTKFLRVERVGETAAKLIRVPCFIAGTLVATEFGLVPIEKIEVGDQVWAWNEATGEVALREVIGLSVTANAVVINLTLTSGERTLEIGVTPSHRFWVTDHGWVPAARLSRGMLLKGKDGGEFKVDRSAIRTSRTTVYNLEVADFHSYHVTSDKICVHNACKADLTVEGRSLGRYIIENHHLLPVKFEKYFKRAGLKIEDYKIPYPRDLHRLKPNGLHTIDGGNWNDEWKRFIQDNPEADAPQILRQLEEMKRIFGIRE